MSETVFIARISLLFQIFYGVPCLIFYLVVLYVVIKKKISIGEDFVRLFVFDGVSNILAYIIYCFGVKVPRVVADDTDLGKFWLTLPTVIPYIIMYSIISLFYLRILMSVLFSFNRFTCLALPKISWISMTHNQFWRKFSVPLLCLVFFGSVINYARYTDVTVVYMEFGNEFIIITGGTKMSSTFFSGSIMTGIATLTNLMLNIYCYWYFRQLHVAKEIEKSLMVYTICNFIVSLICVVHSFMQYIIATQPLSFTLFERFLFFQLTNYISDIRCFSEPFILVALCRTIRLELKRYLVKPPISTKISVFVSISKFKMQSVSIESTPTPKWSTVKSMLCTVTKPTSTIRKRLYSLSNSSSSSSSEDSCDAKKFREHEGITEECQTIVSIPCNLVVKTPTMNLLTSPTIEESNKEIGEGSFIPNTNYLLGKMLGFGAYGKVYSATRDNKKYAIKINRNWTKTNMENNEHERHVLKTIAESGSFKYLVSCFGTVQFEHNLCFVMEKLDVSLENILTKSVRPLQLRTVIHLTEQICLGLKALMALGYVHLDIKPGNILFCSVQDEKDAWKIKLCDFGLATPKKDILKYEGPCQTIHYRAPEVLLGLPKCDKVDSWSIGCVVFYVYTGFELFSARKELEMISQIRDIVGLPTGFEKGHQTAYYFNKADNGELVLNTPRFDRLMPYKKKNFEDLEKLGYNFSTKGKSKDLDCAITTLIESMLRPEPKDRFSPDDALEFLKVMKEVCPDDL